MFKHFKMLKSQRVRSNIWVNTSTLVHVPADLWYSVSSWQPRSRSSWLSISSDLSGNAPPEQDCAGGGRRGSSKRSLPSIWICSLGEEARKKTKTKQRWIADCLISLFPPHLYSVILLSTLDTAFSHTNTEYKFDLFPSSAWLCSVFLQNELVVQTTSTFIPRFIQAENN